MMKMQESKWADMKPRIVVIGVGGGGGNAVNNMLAAGLTGVTFIVANTDAQALSVSSAETRIQLGARLTEGIGAGAKPEIGEAAAEEALDEIRAALAGSHMVFIAAGMGGGTGTGAASVIARVAKEFGILTVAVVTKPFLFEGKRRMRVAEAGIAELKRHVDTLLVIPNQNLFKIANDRTPFAEAFLLADQVLYSGVACIVDLVVKEGLINLDLADVRAVLSGMGTAMMGTGEASGDHRAVAAATGGRRQSAARRRDAQGCQEPAAVDQRRQRPHPVRSARRRRLRARRSRPGGQHHLRRHAGRGLRGPDPRVDRRIGHGPLAPGAGKARQAAPNGPRRGGRGLSRRGCRRPSRRITPHRNDGARYHEWQPTEEVVIRERVQQHPAGVGAVSPRRSSDARHRRLSAQCAARVLGQSQRQYRGRCRWSCNPCASSADCWSELPGRMRDRRRQAR